MKPVPGPLSLALARGVQQVEEAGPRLLAVCPTVSRDLEPATGSTVFFYPESPPPSSMAVLSPALSSIYLYLGCFSLPLQLVLSLLP